MVNVKLKILKITSNLLLLLQIPFAVAMCACCCIVRLLLQIAFAVATVIFFGCLVGACYCVMTIVQNLVLTAVHKILL